MSHSYHGCQLLLLHRLVFPFLSLLNYCWRMVIDVVSEERAVESVAVSMSLGLLHVFGLGLFSWLMCWLINKILPKSQILVSCSHMTC